MGPMGVIFDFQYRRKTINSFSKWFIIGSWLDFGLAWGSKIRILRENLACPGGGMPMIPRGALHANDPQGPPGARAFFARYF